MHWNFFNDYFNLIYDDFFSRVSSIPELANLLGLRSRILKGEKMHKDEKKQARKSLNIEQKEYLEELEKKAKKQDGERFFKGKQSQISNYLKKRGDKNANRNN